MKLPHIVAVALTVLWLCPCAVAAAQDEDPDVARVEQLSVQGAELFQAGSYRDAIVRFKEAYALVPVANLLYNIALSYERLGDLDAAISYYEKFIVADDADPEVRGVALGRLKDLGRARRAEVVDPIGPDDEKASDAKEKGNGGAGSQNDGVGGWTTVGIITAAVGVALAGTAVVFGQISSSDQENFNQTVDRNQKELTRSAAEKNALTADILFGAGGLAIAGGLIMIILDLTSSDSGDERDARFTPQLGTDNIGASLTLSF